MSVERRFETGQPPETGTPDSETRAARPSLQSLLLEAGVASEDELRHAFEEGQLRSLRLGEVVLARGWLDQQGLARLLARQWGLPYLPRESLGLDPTAAGLLSPEQARSLGGCVIGMSDEHPVVVVAEPTAERMGALEALLGSSVHFAVVTEQSLEGLLEQRDRFRATAVSVPAAPEGAAAGPPTEPGRTSEPQGVATEDAQTEELVADLALATAGLTAARERIEQLTEARRGAEHLLADLHERLAGLDRERTQAQERSTQAEVALESERARFNAFRHRLAELLAEFES